MDHYFLGRAAVNKGVTAELLDDARSHFDRALDLDPDNVDALVRRAWVDVVSVANWLSEDRYGRLRSAEVDLSKALRLRPENANARAVLGWARIYSNRALQAAALAHLGRIEEALEAARAGLELDPSFSSARLRRSMTFSDNPVYLARRERLYEGLRLAGVPEG
jgi:tetratricopeptide (TPR) repeat protein